MSKFPGLKVEGSNIFLYEGTHSKARVHTLGTAFRATLRTEERFGREIAESSMLGKAGLDWKGTKVGREAG